MPGFGKGFPDVWDLNTVDSQHSQEQPFLQCTVPRWSYPASTIRYLCPSDRPVPPVAPLDRTFAQGLHWRAPPDDCNTYSSFSFVDACGYSEREVSFSINAPMSQGLSKPVKIGASCLPATLALLCV